MRKSDGTEGVQSRGGVVVVVVVGAAVVVVAPALVSVEDSAVSDSDRLPVAGGSPLVVDASTEVADGLWVVETVWELSSETAALEQDSSTSKPTATGRSGCRDADVRSADRRLLTAGPASGSRSHRVLCPAYPGSHRGGVPPPEPHRPLPVTLLVECRESLATRVDPSPRSSTPAGRPTSGLGEIHRSVPS